MCSKQRLPVYSGSLIRFFTWHILDSQGCEVFLADSKDSDQTADAQADSSLHWPHMSDVTVNVLKFHPIGTIFAIFDL